MTTVKLISHTQFPLETIYLEWLASRSEDPIPTAEELHEQCQPPLGLANNTEESQRSLEELRNKIVQTFLDVVTMKLSIAETLYFTFLIEDCSIALREQMVRHRVGHKFGSLLGCDIIPEMTTSTFWSQTSRARDMGSFASDGRFLTPASFNGKMIGNTPAPEWWRKQMGWIQKAYREMVAAGIPMEDARNILPLATTHRLTWTINYMALANILSKRGCWIAQLGIWEPVIRGMVDELATKIHPHFRRLIDPPCFSGDEYTGCKFKAENNVRLDGTFVGIPCPLFTFKELGGDLKSGWLHNDAMLDERFRMEEAYKNLWGRNTRTGVRLNVIQ